MKKFLYCLCFLLMAPFVAADPPGEFNSAKPAKAVLTFQGGGISLKDWRDWKGLKAEVENDVADWMAGKRKVLSLPPGVNITFYDKDGNPLDFGGRFPFGGQPPIQILPGPPPNDIK